MTDSAGSVPETPSRANVGASFFVCDGECAFTEDWQRHESEFCRAPSVYLIESPAQDRIYPVCVDHAAWARAHHQAPVRVTRAYLASVPSGSYEATP